ncbi:hypothetical protein H6P81_005955 [Aristolochia fimbriata]|uniref:non-specific serine/threonine protein kinase n=1 Tax=Aristolochia fimbriata TaxID=158543 RepID=A0AAV7EX41_ARIFI|nr:hypothetical protein H6P81_005955 [Aristolochia fimbriata]
MRSQGPKYMTVPTWAHQEFPISYPKVLLHIPFWGSKTSSTDKSWIPRTWVTPTAHLDRDMSTYVGSRCYCGRVPRDQTVVSSSNLLPRLPAHYTQLFQISPPPPLYREKFKKVSRQKLQSPEIRDGFQRGLLFATLRIAPGFLLVLAWNRVGHLGGAYSIRILGNGGTGRGIGIPKGRPLGTSLLTQGFPIVWSFSSCYGMAVAKSNSSPSSTLFSDCCKVGSLTDTLLDFKQSSSFEDRYLLGEQLGWGQFGIIRLCSDRLTGEVFACKSIAKDRLVTPDDLCSVKLEIEIMTKLSGHPNVVDLKAVYEEEDYVHLVMELCAGGELFHRLEKHGKFLESQAQVLFKHLMEVVKYCHDKGIVHRDLKPENILLATKSPSSPIKLADFGLATYIKPGKNLHGTVGSPFYIAPEVLAGGYNEAADVWSAGVILYILLSGMPPFWGKTKSKIFDAVRTADLQFPANPWDHVSTSAKDLINQMLCRDPAHRLTAAKVLDHAWLKNRTQISDAPSIFADPNCKQLELSCASFSTTLVSESCDFGFQSEAPGPCGLQLESSPAFTCKSSFSSFLVDPTPLSTASGVFSFQSCGSSNSLEFSSPVSSFPSFTFFSPASPNAKEDQTIFPANRSIIDAIQREGIFEELFKPADPTECVKHDIKQAENNKTSGSRTGPGSFSKSFAIHNKRNRTIGLGEMDQLDLVVTESIFRWASCTVPSAPSLRSSLVC